MSKDLGTTIPPTVEQSAYAPISWANGRLRLIDQTLLPRELRYLELETVSQVAEAITSMRVRGAPAIGIAAAYGLVLATITSRTHTSLETLLSSMDYALAQLTATRPTAVNLRWALERVRAAVDHADDIESLKAAALTEAQAIHNEQLDSDTKMAKAGTALLGTEVGLMTVCNTGPLATGGAGTALGVITAAWQSGQVREVLACETRPRLQGAKLTSWELQQQGVPHRIVVEGAAASIMDKGQIDAVLVGADRIAVNGDTANKIGTYTLAVLAKHHRIPFYVVAPTSTIDPATADGATIPIEERDEAEILKLGTEQIAPTGVSALNPAFDVTPGALITAIVTEHGVLRPPYGPSIKSLLLNTAPARA